MVRTGFERELRRLNAQVLALGSEVGENILEAVRLLRERDQVGAKRLIRGDTLINQKRITIMNDALILIATQQPMARDMRTIASILEIAGELERMNDYCKGIARISLMLGLAPVSSALDGLPEMAAKTQAMLKRALEAFGNLDVELAKQIPAADDEVDALFNKIYQNLINSVLKDPASIERINQLEWAAHNLERAADRVTNICEWVVYNATGSYREMDSELEAPPAFLN
jgi:phosphate transport system protein